MLCKTCLICNVTNVILLPWSILTSFVYRTRFRTVFNRLERRNSFRLYRLRFNMLGVRVNIFNDNGLGEPEQDANSALTELDKGTCREIFKALSWNEANVFRAPFREGGRAVWGHSAVPTLVRKVSVSHFDQRVATETGGRFQSGVSCNLYGVSRRH